MSTVLSAPVALSFRLFLTLFQHLLRHLLARIEDVLWIESQLDLRKRLRHPFAEELAVQMGQLKAVAVFAAQHAAHRLDQLQQTALHGIHHCDVSRRLKVEQRPDVEAAGAGMGVERRRLPYSANICCTLRT